MNHLFWVSITSAVLGSVFTIYTTGNFSPSEAVAAPQFNLTQTTDHPTSAWQPNFSEPIAVQAPDVADERRFTAEEAVNISVYDKVNRSVVNIDTTTNRGELWFLGGPQTEDRRRIRLGARQTGAHCY